MARLPGKDGPVGSVGRLAGDGLPLRDTLRESTPLEFSKRKPLATELNEAYLHAMTKHSPRRLLAAIPLLLLGLLLSGCATSPSPDPNPIDIFREGQTPSRPYQELRVLTDDGGLGEQGGIEERMIKQAKRLGADALIFAPLVQTGNELQGFGLVASYLYKASAVRYTGP